MILINSENKYNEVQLAYGKKGYKLKVPTNFDVIEPKRFPLVVTSEYIVISIFCSFFESSVNLLFFMKLALFIKLLL